LIVPRLRVSAEAETDIDEIVAYTIATWGPEQGDIYLAKLETGLNLLVTNPNIGRLCDSLQKGLRRFEIEHHVAFYMPEPDGVFVVRVLHQTMLPSRYF
jgi:toxin ParE1/3/4